MSKSLVQGEGETTGPAGVVGVVSLVYRLPDRQFAPAPTATQEGSLRCPGSRGGTAILDRVPDLSTVTASASERPPEAAALLRDVLERIGDKWSVIVVCRLEGQPRRFNELRRMTEGITQRMLSTTLRRLERDGLVTRTVFPTVPPQVQYALTDRGETLHDVLSQLVSWTDVNLTAVLAARADYDARDVRRS